VLAGGIRRSAMICLFDHDDEAMITCKYGDWWETNEQRGRANNSAVLKRGEISEEQFKSLWERIEASGSGEPGIYWTNDTDWGTNPCCEIALRPYQFCNLCEVNVSDIQNQIDLNDRVSVAAFFGTLQAGFFDFHYLRPIWARTTQKDALLGIGMTGIGSGEILKYNLEIAANTAMVVNQLITEKIGTNEAARITCIKPSGTTSLVLGTASGIHAWHNDYYLRTMRFNKNEDVAVYLMANHPELCEDDVLRPTDTVCVRIPVKAPEGSIFRTETAIDTLERVKKFSNEWIKPGHIDGANTHNVSATISIDKDRKYYQNDVYKEEIDKTVWEWWEIKDLYGKTPTTSDNIDYSGVHNEWEAVGDWMWTNRDVYNGLSVLPHFGGSYKQAPFEDITKEEYEERIITLKNVDLTKVTELDDTVDFGQVAACAGGACEINI
jgi:ribonucleoside-diphosphate reductase alpha chain